MSQKANIPRLIPSQLKILNLAGTGPMTMAAAEKELHPLPAHATVTFLLDLGLLEHDRDPNGNEVKVRFVLSDLGEATAEKYATGKLTPAPEPTQHEKVIPPGATKERVVKPKAAKGKGRAKAEPVNADDEG